MKQNFIFLILFTAQAADRFSFHLSSYEYINSIRTGVDWFESDGLVIVSPPSDPVVGSKPVPTVPTRQWIFLCETIMCGQYSQAV